MVGIISQTRANKHETRLVAGAEEGLLDRQAVSWSASAAITKYHRLGGLNHRFYFSQFWKLVAWHQDASMLGSSWLVAGCLLSVSSHGLSWVVHMWVSLSLSLSSSDKPTKPIRLGSHPYESPNLHYLQKALTPNTVTLGGYSFNTWIWKGHSSIHSTLYEKSL